MSGLIAEGWEALWAREPASTTVAWGSLFACVVFSSLSLVALRRELHTLARTARALAATALFSSLSFGFSRAAEARAAWLRHALDGEHLWPGPETHPIAAEHAWLLLVALPLTLGVPMIAAATIPAMERGGARPTVAAAAAVTGLTGLLAVAYLLAQSATFSAGFANPPWSDRVLDLERLGGRLDGAQVVLAVAGLLAVVALGWRGRRRTERAAPTDWKTLSAALVVALVGAGAFVATRGHARDRRHPVPLIGDGDLDRDRSALAVVPAADCSPIRDPAPLLRIDPGGATTLDARTVDGPELERQLRTLRRNWSALFPRRPFTGSLLVEAPRELSTERIRPLLRHARAAGWETVLMLAVADASVSTATLGRVERARLCALGLYLRRREDLRAPTDLSPLPPTWGEAIEQSRAREAVLVVEP